MQGRPWEVGDPIVLCKTCSVWLCVLEQSKVGNSSAGSNWLKTGTGGIYASMFNSRSVGTSPLIINMFCIFMAKYTYRHSIIETYSRSIFHVSMYSSIQYARPVSSITCIRYVHNQKIAKLNILKVLWCKHTKGSKQNS